MKIKTLPGLFILAIIFLTACNQVSNEYESEINEFRNELNEFFADSVKSPLTDEDRLSFHGLEFFQIDGDYRLEAQFTLTHDSEAFQMPTTTSRLVWYKKYAEASFKLDGEDFSLAIYQNQDLIKNEKYKKHLFLPFKDFTNGVESYGGGRYIDLEIPEENTIIIDFNKSYNPYCAYNHKYSCPIPPDENHLQTGIRAGVMDFGH